MPLAADWEDWLLGPSSRILMQCLSFIDSAAVYHCCNLLSATAEMLLSH